MAKQEPPWEEVKPTDWVDWFPDVLDGVRQTDEELDAILKDARKDPAWVAHQQWVKKNRPR